VTAKRPVISIGNLAMGGRGKTPVTALVARMLVDTGERPAILSRGYKRREPDDGVVVVSDGRTIHAGLDRSGDEPLMLAERVPGAAVLVCDVRATAAALAEETLDVTVHVLDDGFQHRSIDRDVDIVIIAPDDLKSRRVPFGRLRSPVSALAKADAVIVDGEMARAGFDESAAALPKAEGRPVQLFFLKRSLGAPRLLSGSPPLPPGRWPVVAVAGIARPERFTQSLREAGWHVATTLKFRDHHAFGRRDLDRIVETAREHGAGAVLTTSKDAVRLRQFQPFAVPLAEVPLDVAVEPAEEFRGWLSSRLREARA
jgi:tetraacyldisaccharide 4'-kinase